MNLFKQAYHRLKSNKFSFILSITIFIVVISTVLSSLLSYKMYENLEAQIFAGISIPLVITLEEKNNISDENWAIWDELYEEIRDLEMVVQSEYNMKLLIDSPAYTRVVEDQYISVNFTEEFPNYGKADQYTISLDQQALESSLFPVIISYEFAQLNNLDINDVITLDYTKDVVGYNKTNVDIEWLSAIEYTIVGIYNFKPIPKMMAIDSKIALKQGYDQDAYYSDRLNELFMPISNAEKISFYIRDEGYTSDDVFTVNQTLYLDKFSNLEEFELQAEEIVGSDLKVSIDYNLANITSKERNALSGYESASYNLVFSIYLVFLTVQIFGLFVVSIVATLISRKRYKHQISLGATRGEVVLQLLCEKLILIAIASPFAIAISLILQNIIFASQTVSVLTTPFIIVRVISAVLIMMSISVGISLVPIGYIYSIKK